MILYTMAGTGYITGQSKILKLLANNHNLPKHFNENNKNQFFFSYKKILFYIYIFNIHFHMADQGWFLGEIKGVFPEPSNV